MTEGTALDPLSHTLYVANGFTGNVLAIDTKTRQHNCHYNDGRFQYPGRGRSNLRQVFVANYSNNVVYDISAGPPTPWKDAHK